MEGIVTLKTDISSCPPSKNPSQEGGLTSDRSAKPSTLGKGDKKETEADAERAVRNDRTPEVESNDGEEEKENWREPVIERATTEKRKHQQNYQAGTESSFDEILETYKRRVYSLMLFFPFLSLEWCIDFEFFALAG